MVPVLNCYEDHQSSTVKGEDITRNWFGATESLLNLKFYDVMVRQQV
jgi:hypothetical protein